MSGLIHNPYLTLHDEHNKAFHIRVSRPEEKPRYGPKVTNVYFLTDDNGRPTPFAKVVVPAARVLCMEGQGATLDPLPIFTGRSFYTLVRYVRDQCAWLERERPWHLS